MLIVDDEVILSTGNYSYSSFTKNRELFVIIQDTVIREKLVKLFLADYTHTKTIIYDDNLIISPYDSRKKMLSLIHSAKSSLKLYVHNIDDEEVLNALILKAWKGIEVKMVFPTSKSVSSNRYEIKKLKDHNIQVATLKKIKLHAKAVLVDDKNFYVWSMNMSFNSISNNREIWIITKKKEVINGFLDVFNGDFWK